MSDLKLAHGLAAYVAGVVAAEGTFNAAVAGERADGSRRPSFTFAVVLGATDRETIGLVHAFFGVGRVRTYPARREHYDDEVVYAVRALDDLVGVVVPFMDEHLPPCHKREQYLVWREELVHYDAERASRRGWSRQRRDDPGGTAPLGWPEPEWEPERHKAQKEG